MIWTPGRSLTTTSHLSSSPQASFLFPNIPGTHLLLLSSFWAAARLRKSYMANFLLPYKSLCRSLPLNDTPHLICKLPPPPPHLPHLWQLVPSLFSSKYVITFCHTNCLIHMLRLLQKPHLYVLRMSVQEAGIFAMLGDALHMPRMVSGTIKIY